MRIPLLLTFLLFISSNHCSSEDGLLDASFFPNTSDWLFTQTDNPPTTYHLQHDETDLNLPIKYTPDGCLVYDRHAFVQANSGVLLNPDTQAQCLFSGLPSQSHPLSCGNPRYCYFRHCAIAYEFGNLDRNVVVGKPDPYYFLVLLDGCLRCDRVPNYFVNDLTTRVRLFRNDPTKFTWANNRECARQASFQISESKTDPLGNFMIGGILGLANRWSNCSDKDKDGVFPNAHLRIVHRCNVLGEEQEKVIWLPHFYPANDKDGVYESTNVQIPLDSEEEAADVKFNELPGKEDEIMNLKSCT